MCCVNDIMVIQTSQLRQIKALEDKFCILNKKVVVRATLPPSTLFADSVLLHRGYSISVPNA